MTSARGSSPRGRGRRTVDPTEYTPGYAYRKAGRGARGVNTLHCEGVALSKIAETVGTPSYVYSRSSIESAYESTRLNSSHSAKSRMPSSA